MIVLNQLVDVNISKRNINFYLNKGYDCSKNVIQVRLEDLSKGSHAEIKILCDYCLEDGIETIIIKSVKDYYSSKNQVVKKDCCKSCKSKKYKESMNIQYGVDNCFQLEEVKDKTKLTNLEKYGVEFISQSSEIQEKIKETSLDKYGSEYYIASEEGKLKRQEYLNNLCVDNVFQLEDIKKRSRETSINKYGVEYYTQTDEYKERCKDTCLEKYGYDNVSKSPEIIEKINEVHNEKYGMQYMKTKEFRNKSKATSLKKYGTLYPTQSNIIKEKTIQTNLERYGVAYPQQNDNIKQKSVESYYKNGSCPTSSQQLEIFNLLQRNNYIIELNYPVGRTNLDTALFINNIKIDIEYDGWHWHKSKQLEDRKRDEFLKSEGWKILRIKSVRMMPSLEQLQESINKLITTDRTFTQIILDDIQQASNE